MEDPIFHQLLDTDAALAPLLEAATESCTADVSVLRALVLKVLQESDIFVGFDQIHAVLLSELQKKTAGTGEGVKILDTLQLFSYGTVADYQQDTSRYLTLSDAHLVKLQQLTVLTVVQDACLNKRSIVPLQEFQTALQQLDLVQTEQLVISCLYQGVVCGQLCQKTASLLLSSRNGPVCRARDVSPSAVGKMLQQIQQLQARLTQTNAGLENEKQVVTSSLQAHRAFLLQSLERVKKAGMSATTSLTGQVRQSLDAASVSAHHGGATSGGGGNSDAMDVSSGPGERGSRRQKRSRGGWSGMGNFGGFQP